VKTIKQDPLSKKIFSLWSGLAISVFLFLLEMKFPAMKYGNPPEALGHVTWFFGIGLYWVYFFAYNGSFFIRRLLAKYKENNAHA